MCSAYCLRLVDRLIPILTLLTITNAQVFINYPAGPFACWTLNTRCPAPNRNHESGGSIQAQTQGTHASEFATALKGLPTAVSELMGATDEARITVHGIYIRNPFTPGGEERWWPRSKNPRVTLLGDAAHPMRPTGQGTAMAMEDAAELSLCIKEFGLGEDALREYESRRIPRCHTVAQRAQKGAMGSYKETAEEAEALQERALPHYIRVNNFHEGMDYSDWLNDISFPAL